MNTLQVNFVQHGPGIIRLPEVVGGGGGRAAAVEPPQQQQQQNRAKKPSFFSFGRKKRSDPDSYRDV